MPVRRYAKQKGKKNKKGNELRGDRVTRNQARAAGEGKAQPKRKWWNLSF